MKTFSFRAELFIIDHAELKDQLCMKRGNHKISLLKCQVEQWEILQKGEESFHATEPPKTNVPVNWKRNKKSKIMQAMVRVHIYSA